MIDLDEIKELIRSGIPDAQITVSGGEGKYEATVVSEQFATLSKVKRHQAIYATVKKQIATGQLHALTIYALTPEESRR